MFKSPFFAVPASISLPNLSLLQGATDATFLRNINMTTADDLAWPELGNVTRGATRGNQGQKGVLGTPDRDGRCVLQLRVQPGVLAVRLNHRASEWYRTLDAEVHRALKLTKTYWRKARRRQDYDASADQDHMELHEWLQQLKDKTMSQLELLMQKGDIPGPPYVMPDDVELTFLRKFVERQANGIPHNPRLRDTFSDPTHTVDSVTSASSNRGSQFAQYDPLLQNSSPEVATSSRASNSPSLHSVDSFMNDESCSAHSIQVAKTALARAKKDTQAAFIKYTTCLEVERQARQAAAAMEKRLSSLSSSENQLDYGFSFRQDSKYCSLSSDFNSRCAPFNGNNQRQATMLFQLDGTQGNRNSPDPYGSSGINTKSMDWNSDIQSGYVSDSTAQFKDQSKQSNKRGRGWENSHSASDCSFACEDMTLMPRTKRLHTESDFEVMNTTTIQTPSIIQT